MQGQASRQGGQAEEGSEWGGDFYGGWGMPKIRSETFETRLTYRLGVSLSPPGYLTVANPEPGTDEMTPSNARVPTQYFSVINSTKTPVCKTFLGEPVARWLLWQATTTNAYSTKFTLWTREPARASAMMVRRLGGLDPPTGPWIAATKRLAKYKK
jgi:hypothetical protein